MSRARVAAVVAVVVLCGACFAVFRVIAPLLRDPLAPVYADNCSTCHGDDLEGANLGTPLVGRELRHGSSVDEIAHSIRTGFQPSGMPAFGATLSDGQIRGLAILISERRANYSRTDFKVDAPLALPQGTVSSERHAFRVERVVDGIDPLPFSIAPLPDGRILVTEKMRGLRIVSADGELGEHIAGTPPTHDDGFELLTLVYGRGWMMDVALHPDYEQNGWVYLHFGDRCRECSPSMNKLVRGRIRDGQWLDEETIWSAAPDTYTETPDMGAGGRISFDGQGHVFLSVGIKGPSNYHGIQDLSRPYGKIHRVHDDGRVPADNPFLDTPGALPTTWSYGHRSPQGLEFDRETGLLWSTEMGPRGGDELNLLRPGRNYGWPLTSKGVNYDGTPVEYGRHLGLQTDLTDIADLADIEQPVLDMTPSPAISSFVVYRGAAFPEWQGNLIAGTLKARKLFRWVLDGEQVVQQETLLEDLARIRDVEVGPDGLVYLLLEHASGGQIVRLVPE